MLEWRNWQTHWTQNPAPFTGHEGSTPSSSTMPRLTSGDTASLRLRPRFSPPLGLAVWAALAISTAALAQTQGTAPSEPRYTLRHGIGDNMPDWLSLGGELRFRGEVRRSLGYEAGRNDSYGLARVRLDIGVKPAKWLKFGFQGQDARAPGIRDSIPNIGAFSDGFDVRQAYSQIGGDDSPVTVTVGRQLLAYGDQRLVGALDWANTARVFDAVKVRVQGAGSAVDIFSASVVQNDPSRRINQSAEGNNLHGIYGSFKRVIPNVILEPYVLWQTTPVVANELNIRGDLDRYTAGMRVWNDDLGAWDYNAAFVRQWGSMANAPIEAWGYYAELGHTFDASLAPRLFAEYTFGSGDEDPNDGKVGGFVDIYPTAHRWYGYNDLVGWRNVKNIRLGTQLWPSSKVRLQFDFHSFWLANKRDALYNVGGRLSVRAPEGGAAETKIGDEVNATVTYNVNKLIGIEAVAGYMFPGPFLKANSPGHGNTFTYLSIIYRF